MSNVVLTNGLLHTKMDKSRKYIREICQATSFVIIYLLPQSTAPLPHQ